MILRNKNVGNLPMNLAGKLYRQVIKLQLSLNNWLRRLILLRTIIDCRVYRTGITLNRNTNFIRRGHFRLNRDIWVNKAFSRGTPFYNAARPTGMTGKGTSRWPTKTKSRRRR